MGKNIIRIYEKLTPEEYVNYKEDRFVRESRVYGHTSRSILCFEFFMVLLTCIRFDFQVFSGKQSLYMSMYLIMIGFMGVMLAVSRFTSFYKANFEWIGAIYLFFIMTWSAVVCLLDQSSYPDVITLVLSMIVISAIGISRPDIVISMYVLGMLLFLVLLPSFQSTEQLRFSEMVNTLIGFIFSSMIVLITYRIREEDYLNKVLIIKKNRELDELAEKIAEANRKLEIQVNTDTLTGISNRNSFERHMEEAFEQADLEGTNVGFAMFDLDNFKSVNDRWGHPIGDEVLIKIAQFCSSAIRKQDLFARLGGEEFVLLMPQTSMEEAFSIVEDLRVKIEGLHHIHGETVTVSVGLAVRHPGEPYSAIYRRADDALYTAKKEGRNKVVTKERQEQPEFVSVEVIWRKEWESGHQELDQQHRELIILANQFVKNCIHDMKSEDTIHSLNQLINHVSAHFTYEEILMNSIGYEDFKDHQKIHNSLVRKILELKRNLLREELSYSEAIVFVVDDVVKNHMIREDIRFFPMLGKR